MTDSITVPTPFPFTAMDISAIVLKYKDGGIYRATVAAPASAGFGASTHPSAGTHRPASYAAYCQHKPTPADPAVFTRGGLDLYVLNQAGSSANKAKFDLFIDCGDTVPVSVIAPDIVGDTTIKSILDPFVTYRPMRLVKIAWPDRHPPDLQPKAWPALAAHLMKEAKAFKASEGYQMAVGIACVGGHGRSGSATAALILCLSPTYSVLDAITHVRAVHCPRAIESAAQIDYLNELGILLGREANGKDEHDVTDFRARFLALASKDAKPYQDRLKATGKLADECQNETHVLAKLTPAMADAIDPDHHDKEHRFDYINM